LFRLPQKMMFLGKEKSANVCAARDIVKGPRPPRGGAGFPGPPQYPPKGGGGGGNRGSLQYPPKLEAVLALVSPRTKGGGVYPLWKKGGFLRPFPGRIPYSSRLKVTSAGHPETPHFSLKHRCFWVLFLNKKSPFFDSQTQKLKLPPFSRSDPLPA
jgi:hypothetical protein